MNHISSSSTITSIPKVPSGPPIPIATYYAGSYDVILFVDNCEQSHAYLIFFILCFKFFKYFIYLFLSKRQDILMDELRKSKIKFESGKLNVGDFTWVCVITL